MALSDLFLINGREYEWADICLVVGGIEIKGFRSINYKESQEKEPLHAKGNKPRSIQRGNKTYTGSLLFTQSEIIALKTATGTRSLLDIQTDIIIAYVPENSAKIRTISILGAEFTDIEEKMAQGDKFMEIELPYVALDTFGI
ncbi:hypothetical protein D0T49_00350 [Paludibacter sp. 221]|uniref:hypothetical protein n=1 Tax=Paludibacter sp. 221 TaxID=2302939 RepID=UPI0013D5AC64|nr:hypothetical protein [Paludibacter sp. 221]NDV45503.1 hypothetical protein [Paludibacter sp. 221]